MAQLVKLHDYISRYETDIYRYPSRYVRLKKERWTRLLNNWEVKRDLADLTTSLLKNNNIEQMEEEETSKNKLRSKLKQWFSKRNNDSFTIDNLSVAYDAENDDYSFFQEMAYYQTLETKEQLRDAFKEELLRFQFNWASSTISEQSDVRSKYYFDPFLSFMLKELPDSFFIFYEPVIYLRKAPVDFDTIILTPSEIWLIATLLGNENTIYQNLSEKYWLRIHKKEKEKILNPGIMIRRMRSVIEHILLDRELSFSIKTAIVAKDSYIDIPQTEQRIKLIDRRNFDAWHRKMVRNVAPIKHQQLKIADVLLQQSLTISRPRNVNIGKMEQFE